MDPMTAQSDFLERVKQYEDRYEAVEDEEFGESIKYIKIINAGQKFIVHGISGHLTSQVASYLMNSYLTAACEKGQPTTLVAGACDA